MFVEDRVSHACNYLKQSLTMFFTIKTAVKTKKESQHVNLRTRYKAISDPDPDSIWIRNPDTYPGRPNWPLKKGIKVIV